jgi:hypothetical protein
MVNVFQDYCTDHLRDKNEDIDEDWRWQIEDEKLK